MLDFHDALPPGRHDSSRLYSTVADLARFAAFEMNTGWPVSILKSDALESIFTRGAMMNSDLTSGYGLGFEVFRRGDLIMFGHGGSVAGFQAGLLFDRHSQTAVVVLRNASGGQFNIGGLAIQSLGLVVAADRNAAK